jgi:putative toxin-antitoxin system antitoxin component (TIGR02293 family)
VQGVAGRAGRFSGLLAIAAKIDYNQRQLAIEGPKPVSTITVEKFGTIESLLGGKAVLRAKPRSTSDWIEMIRHGMPAAAVDSLLKAVRLSQSDLARALGIPERTLARRKREGLLSSEESAKLLRLARVVGRAKEVFDDSEAAIHWLKSPNTALGRQTPLSLLDTDIGAESVLDTLGRIEHGVFA